MINDQPLYDAITEGLTKAEDEMASLGISHWKVAIVAYDPDNPHDFVAHC